MKKNMAKIFFLVIAIYSCKTSKQAGDDGLFKRGTKCPMERIDWMKVTTSYDKTKVSNLAFAIGAAATANANEIKKLGSANANAGITDSLAKTISDSTKSYVEVSQEFYESYLKQRTALCNMYELLKLKEYFNDIDFRKRLMDQYFDVTKNFTTIGESEKKNRQ